MSEPAPEEFVDGGKSRLRDLQLLTCWACGLKLYDSSYIDPIGWAVPGLGVYDRFHYHVRCLGLAKATRRFNRAFAAAMRTRTIVPGPPPTDTDV